MSPVKTQTVKIMKWSDIKRRGSTHYKRDPSLIEPIDLYKDGDMLRDFALCCIIKYAYRNRGQTGKPINPMDLDKIHHYVDMLKVVYVDKKQECI